QGREDRGRQGRPGDRQRQARRPGRAPGAEEPVQGLRPRLHLGRGRPAPALAVQGIDLVIARLRDESGQASAELMGMIWWLVLVTVIVWQICLVAWTYTQVSNAARTASRVEGRGGDGEKAAKNALSKPLQKTIQKIDDNGEKAVVKVKMPLLIPGLLDSDQLLATG